MTSSKTLNQNEAESTKVALDPFVLCVASIDINWRLDLTCITTEGTFVGVEVVPVESPPVLMTLATSELAFLNIGGVEEKSG